MTINALARLSARDWDLLRDLATSVPFRRGDVILEEGSMRRALMIIRAGAVCVQRAERGSGITIAQLGAGEIFGEMGFVENAPASASVTAETDGSVDVIAAEALQSLMVSEPGFAVRFYHSIAITLARRLRLTSRRLAEAGASEAAQLNRYRHTRTGNISSRQMPSELVAEIDAFGQAILVAADQTPGAGSGPGAAAMQDAVSAACDGVLAALDRFTDSTPLIDIGLDDLLAFRDTEQLETGVGDYVFRETFPTFMLSTTMARCYAKPRGYPDDFETIATIYRSDPEGDGRLGPAIDCWFLNRPISQARRAGRDHIRAALAEEAAVFQARGVVPRIASLASGAAAELLDICADEGLAVLGTCVDLDSDALLAAADRAERGNFADRMTFLQSNVLPMEGEGAALVPQHVIYALGLGEYLSDGQFVALLDRSFENLVPGGAFFVGNLAAGHPDRLLMEHILDWKTEARTEQQLTDLFRRSRFGAAPLTATRDETGVSIYLRCVRPA